VTVATIRRRALWFGVPKRPTRVQRFLNAAYWEFVVRGEWSSKDDLQRHFMHTGAVEFYKSWPWLSTRFVRITKEHVELSVEALAQVDGAQLFLGQFISALHIAVEQYQDKGSKPLLSVDRLVADVSGATELRAKGLMRVLEGEGLLRRASPKASSGILTARLTRFTGVEDVPQYLREARGLTRGRRLKLARAFIRGFVVRVVGPDSSLWVKLAVAAVMAALGLLIGSASGLSP
jgi:hypothetical protein